MNFWENKIGDFEFQKGVSAQSDLSSDDGKSLVKLGHLLVDVYQDKTNLMLVAPVPGVSSQDLVLELEEDILTIQARRSISDELLEADFLVKECYWGEVRRAIVLPEGIDLNSIDASLEEGLLKIKFLKKGVREIKKIVI